MTLSLSLYPYTPDIINRGSAEINIMWGACAAILGFAVVATALGGGVGALGDYLGRVTLLGGPWPDFMAGGLVALHAAAACLLVWPRTRRIGWILVGGLGGGYISFHALAFAFGSISPIAGLDGRFLAGGGWTHLLGGALGVGLVIAAYASAVARRPSAAVITTGDST